MKRLIFAAALLLASGAAQASQNSLVGGNFPTVSPYPGLTLVENINSAMEAINSMNSGASAPSYEVQGTMFANTSSGIEEFYSGSNWLFTGSYTGSAYVPISNGVPLGNCPTSGGSSNAYTVTYSPAPSAWAVGQPYCFYTNFSNTSSATVNPSGLGAKPLTKNGTTSLSNGDLGSGVEVECVYDGTDCEIVSQLSSTFPAAGAWSVLSNSTTTTALPSFTATPTAQAWYVGPIQGTSAGKTGLISPSAGALELETTGSSALYASSTGSIGIGTIAPGQPLEVNGNAKIDGNLTVAACPVAGCIAETLLNTVNASAAASVVFNSTYLTSSYNKYVVELDGAYTSDSGALIVLISSNNGGSYLNSGYSQGGIQMPMGGGSFTNFGSFGSTAFDLSGATGLNSSASSPSTGTFKFANPSVAANLCAEWTMAVNGGTQIAIAGGGCNSATTAINNIKIVDSTGGNITGNFHLVALNGN